MCAVSFSLSASTRARKHTPTHAHAHTRRWDKLVLQQGEEPAPRARSAHVSVWDWRSKHIILFGGLGANGRDMLNDCWLLPVANPAFILESTEALSSLFGWKTCQVNSSEPVAAPRYGHSAVYHSGIMFIFGGYQQVPQSSFSIAAELTSDVWALEDYLEPTRRWRQINPLSTMPPSRAFNALWMTGGRDGFKMVIHGGQSDSGYGRALSPRCALPCIARRPCLRCLVWPFFRVVCCVVWHYVRDVRCLVYCCACFVSLPSKHV